MWGLALPFIAQGLGSIFGGFGNKGQNESYGQANLQDRYRYDVLNQQAFDPMAPYRRLKRGALYSSFARAWGLDKILPEGMLEHLENPENYPGTDKIGGGQYPTGPPEGIPGGERKGGGWGALGGIASGLGTALSGLYPGGGGGAPGGIPDSSMDWMDKQRGY